MFFNIEARMLLGKKDHSVIPIYNNNCDVLYAHGFHTCVVLSVRRLVTTM